MMERGVAVYVLQQGGSRVELRDGRIRCSTPGGTCSEVPLERLEFLVLFEGTSIETDAIHAAVRAGVEVGFATSGGNVFASVSPYVEPGDLQRLLDHRRADASWIRAYRRWLGAWVKVRRLGAAARLDPETHRKWRDEGFNRKQWDAWCRRMERARGLTAEDPGVDTARAYLGFLIKMQIGRRLRELGIQAGTHIVPTREGHGLISDLLRPFRPWIFEQIIEAAGVRTPFRHVQTPNGRRRLGARAVEWWSKRYERHRGLIDVELLMKLDELCELIRVGTLCGLSAQKVAARSREQAGALRAL